MIESLLIGNASSWQRGTNHEVRVKVKVKKKGIEMQREGRRKRTAPILEWLLFFLPSFLFSYPNRHRITSPLLPSLELEWGEED